MNRSQRSVITRQLLRLSYTTRRLPQRVLRKLSRQASRPLSRAMAKMQKIRRGRSPKTPLTLPQELNVKLKLHPPSPFLRRRKTLRRVGSQAKRQAVLSQLRQLKLSPRPRRLRKWSKRSQQLLSHPKRRRRALRTLLQRLKSQMRKQPQHLAHPPLRKPSSRSSKIESLDFLNH